MTGKNCTNNEKKSCKNASCLHSIKRIALGLLLLLCLCGFKTFIQLGDEKYSDENSGHKSRQLLQDKDGNIRVSIFQYILPIKTFVFCCLNFCGVFLFCPQLTSHIDIYIPTT